MKNIHLIFDGFLSNWLPIGFTNVYSYLWYMKKLVSCILTSALCSISQSNGNKHHFNLYFLDFSKVFFFNFIFELLAHVLCISFLLSSSLFAHMKFLNLFKNIFLDIKIFCLLNMTLIFFLVLVPMDVL